MDSFSTITIIEDVSIPTNGENGKDTTVYCVVA
jgi:hypothetical protein